MAGYVVLAVLAAFGLMSALWALAGLVLPPVEAGWLLCPGRPGAMPVVRLYRWLHGLGLVRCPLIVLDLGLTDCQRAFLEGLNIEICGPEALAARLGTGAEEN